MDGWIRYISNFDKSYKNPGTNPIEQGSAQSLQNVPLRLFNMNVSHDTEQYHQRYMTKVEHAPALLQRTLHQPRLESALRSATRSCEEEEKHNRDDGNDATLDIQILYPLKKQRAILWMTRLHEEQQIKRGVGQQQRRNDHPTEKTVVRRQSRLRDACDNG